MTSYREVPDCAHFMVNISWIHLTIQPGILNEGADTFPPAGNGVHIVLILFSLPLFSSPSFIHPFFLFPLLALLYSPLHPYSCSLLSFVSFLPVLFYFSFLPPTCTFYCPVYCPSYCPLCCPSCLTSYCYCYLCCPSCCTFYCPFYCPSSQALLTSAD